MEFATEGNAMTLFANALDLYFGGDLNASLALTGQVAGRIEDILPVADIVRGRAEECLAVLSGLADRYLAGR